MKIGIITQPLGVNYGGLLQNYALQTVLRRLGHEVVTMDQPNRQIRLFRLLASAAKTFLLKLVGKGKQRNYLFVAKANQIKHIAKNTDYFINKYIARSIKLIDANESARYVRDNHIEVFVVGSDQVWRPKYNVDIYHSFLDFTQGMDIRRIAYAASFGVDVWEYSSQETEYCNLLVQAFQAVSVREESGVTLCAKHLGVKAISVLDPTMLLDKEDYEFLVEQEKESSCGGNMLCYILDKSEVKNRIINDVAELLHLSSFTVMPIHLLNRETVKIIDQCVFPPVTKWLRGFVDADFVVCDSFHGAVFSIIFNKPFLVIANKDRGMARFHSLLRIYGLEDRLITDDIDLSLLEKPIDWIAVNRKREEMKEISLNFLRENLK